MPVTRAQPHFLRTGGTTVPHSPAEGRLVHPGSPFCPPTPNDDPPRRPGSDLISVPQSEQPHSPGRQAGRQGWEETPGPSHLFTPPATSAILTYNNYHDDGADGSQHDHHLVGEHGQRVSPWVRGRREGAQGWGHESNTVPVLGNSGRSHMAPRTAGSLPTLCVPPHPPIRQ